MSTKQSTWANLGQMLGAIIEEARRREMSLRLTPTCSADGDVSSWRIERGWGPTVITSTHSDARDGAEGVLRALLLTLPPESRRNVSSMLKGDLGPVEAAEAIGGLEERLGKVVQEHRELAIGDLSDLSDRCDEIESRLFQLEARRRVDEAPGGCQG